MITVGAYVRMSDDDPLGIRQQIADCRDRSRELDLPVGKVYEDNDTSAFKEHRYRPGFEDLLRDLADGVITGVIVTACDRIARQPQDLERLIEVYDHSQFPPLFVTCEENIGLATEGDRSRARLLVAVAQQESVNLARRVSRANKAHAETGKAHRGGRRPFGWEQDGLRADPFEARLIREAYRDLVAGASISSVRRKWIEAGVTPLATKRSGEAPRQINHRSVRDRLINPRLCGFRVHLPQSIRESLGRAPWLPDHIVRDERGNPVTGDWDRIVEVAEWQEVVRLLLARTQRQERAPHSTESRFFLSGIARCGACGTGMRPNPYLAGSAPAERYGFRYVCRTADGGCGGVSRVGPPVDEAVESALLNRLREVSTTARDDIVSSAPAAPAVAEQIRTAEGELRHVWGLRSAGVLHLAEFNERRYALTTRAAGHFIELRTVEARRRALAEELPRLAESWEDRTLTDKRQTFLDQADHVVIHPAGRGNRFDPSLIEICWKSEPSTFYRHSRSNFTVAPISLISDSMAG